MNSTGLVLLSDEPYVCWKLVVRWACQLAAVVGRGLVELILLLTVAQGQSYNPIGVVVAGGNREGSGVNQLNDAWDVHVDAAGNIYVADYGNNRIQKWASKTMGRFLIRLALV
jgi:hypothetical protein